MTDAGRRSLPLIFNGKFYSGRLNGVHRVADRLIRQVDRILAAQPADERVAARLYLPADRTWSPDVGTIDIVEDPRAVSQRWEQMVLPRLAADGILINLCNLAPLLHRRKLLLVHDAQFLFSDSSYPTAQRLGYKYLIPLMARRAQRVLTVSDYSKRILDVSHVSPSDHTSVLYNGADHMLDAAARPEVLAEFGLTPQCFVVIFGSPKEYKNVEVVFRAFHDPRLAAQTLVVVGEGEATLRAAGLTPPPGALFVGPIDDGRLRTLYEHATCLAFPSKTEGFGLPPLEGMLLGCPAVVAPAGAIPEICHDAALYAAVDAPGEWADAIVTLAGDRELRAAKIAAGRARAGQFTWARAGQRLLDVAMTLNDPERRLAPAR